MIIDELRNIKSTKTELRKFGFAVGLVLIGIGGFVFFTKGLRASAYLSLGSGAALVLLGFFLPAILLPLQKVWMTIAVILGWVMTRVILSILFFMMVTPIGLISRTFGSNFLEVKWRPSKDSYWNVRDRKPFDKTHSERQF